MRRLVSMVVIALFMGSFCMNVMAKDQKKDYWKDETQKEKDARMEWWREARFGMFIHWGLYSILEGEWKGNKEHAEWIKRTGQIKKETYDKLADQFNPVKFDADAWVKMAKRAGMKYIVITSKHHDGFCLWPSKVGDYDIEITPYKKDLLGQLTKACKKHGLRMCFYHSVMDWHHPHYTPKHSWDPGTNPKDGAPDYSKYVGYMKAQLKELVDSYDPGLLWFDGEWEGTWTHDHGVDLYQYMRELDEDIIVNNRVDKGRHGMQGMTKDNKYRGDFGTPEQEIPATGLSGVDWESCMTMSSKWGWNKADTKWRSGADLIRKLVDIASKGGNFLLNIGPKPDGTFPDKAIKRLEIIGKWMEVNSESIYGTEASPFGLFDWGRCTMKKHGRKTYLYLNVFNWPESGVITIPVSNKVKGCVGISDPDGKVEAVQTGTAIKVSLTGAAPDPICSVVKLVIKGEPIIEDIIVMQGDDGTIQLNAKDAVLKAGNGGAGPVLETKGGPEQNIGSWINVESWAQWPVKVEKSGLFKIQMETAAPEDSQMTLSVSAGNGAELAETEVKTAKTGTYEIFKVTDAGTVAIPKKGDYVIAIRPDKKAWSAINLRNVKLVPAK